MLRQMIQMNTNDLYIVHCMLITCNSTQKNVAARTHH